MAWLSYLAEPKQKKKKKLARNEYKRKEKGSLSKPDMNGGNNLVWIKRCHEKDRFKITTDSIYLFQDPLLF